MYAIIRAGGKQAKVSEGDVLDVERIKAEGEMTFTPLLLVTDDGTVISDRDALAKTSVTVEILGENRGEKVDVFKYKNKTGYRRRQGHRQTYTRIRVAKIDAGAKKKAATKKAATKKAAPKAEPAEETPVAEDAAVEAAAEAATEEA